MNEDALFILIQCFLGGCCLFLQFLIIVACISVANKKNRNPVVWGALGFFFSFWALLILMLLPSEHPPQPSPYGYGPPPPPPPLPYPSPYAAPPPSYSPPYAAPPVAPPQTIHETMLQSGPRLAIIGGPDSGQTYALGKQTRLGRNPDNDVVLTDSQVSRHHALIQRQGATYTVSDLSSGNGVHLNGKLISSPTNLTAGDIVTIGNTQMRVD